MARPTPPRSIEDLVSGVLRRHARGEARIEADTEILGPELGLDSIGLLEAIIELENLLSITLRDEDLDEEALSSIARFTNHLRSRLLGAGTTE